MAGRSKQQVSQANEEETEEVYGGKEHDIGSLVPARHLSSTELKGTNGNGTVQLATAGEPGVETRDTRSVPSRENFQEPRRPDSQPTTVQVAKDKNKKKEKFNVEKAMKSLPGEMLARLQKGLTILNFNISGLRTDYKKESLKEMAYQLKFDVGVITETHLLNHEADALKIPHYSVLHREGHSRRKGGVLILAHENVACRKLETIIPLPRLVDGCSCMLYPTKDERYPIRVTGLYVPPSAEADPELLAEVTQPCVEDRDGQISQLIVGDLNTNTWRGGCSDKYYEWLSEAGLWELSDPDLPTFKSNTVIDKFLLRPGEIIPEEWIISTRLGDASDDMEGDVDEEVRYPVVTFPCQWVADHHPQMMILREQREDESGPGKHDGNKLRIKDLTREDWDAKNEEMTKYLERTAGRLSAAYQVRNLNYYWDLLLSGIREVLRDSGTRAGRKSQAQPVQPPPFQEFCRRHLRHPEYSLLISSIMAQDKVSATEVMQRMTRDDWRRYLEETRSTNTSAFFLGLARMEGRKPRSGAFPCKDPLLDPDGTRRFRAQEKCDLLANFFAERLSAQSDTKPGRPTSGKNGGEGYRPPMRGEVEKVREVEVRKAIGGLAGKKAAGLDGLVAEVFQNMPCLIRPLTRLFDGILETGRMPQKMLQVVMIPLDKVGRDPERCGSKRPISLIPVVSKVLEAVILHRLLSRFESCLEPCQYAYRRERGTEMHLLDLTDFIREARNRGQYAYLASIDVAAAFDNISHSHLLRTMEELAVDTYTCRYVNTWLRNRVFRLRLRTSGGNYMSAWKRITKGVPQGGVLSPFLWLLHFNPLVGRVRAAMWAGLSDREKAEFTMILLLYADDVVCAIAHHHLIRLCELARLLGGECVTQLKRLGLWSECAKSANFVMSPNYGGSDLFRRGKKGGGGEGLATGVTGAQPQISRTNDGNGYEVTETGDCAHLRLPYPEVEEMRILGVIFDCDFSFERHFTRICEKTRVRMAILGRLATSSWGLESTMMRITGEALVVSLLRFGLTVVGSGLADGLMRRLDTTILNVMARRTTGVARTARIPVLHATAGILSAHNLFIQQCASMVDLSLRATGASVQARVSRWMECMYGVSTWKTTGVVFDVRGRLPERVGELRYLDFDMRETWIVQLLPTFPRMDERMVVPSVFHSTSPEIRADPAVYRDTYDYQGAESWFEIGLQVLVASGWRPDCTVDSPVNLGKSLPPKDAAGRIIIEPSVLMRYTEATEQAGYRAWMENPEGGVDVAVSVFYQQGMGASCAAVTPCGGLPCAQGWILGVDPVSLAPPEFMLEAGLLHALLLVEQHSRLAAEDPPPFYQVRTGTWGLMMGLIKWFNEGSSDLVSAAAADIVMVLGRLETELVCPLILRPLPGDFFEATKDRGTRAQDVISTTAKRLFAEIGPLAHRQFGSRIARLPWTSEEVKRNCKTRYKADEARVLRALEQVGSISSSIFRCLGLSRDIIRRTIKRFRGRRRPQVVLATIICATRFKTIAPDGGLLEVRCLKCGGTDSFEHLLECMSVGPLPNLTKEEDVVDFLVRLTWAAVEYAPLWPTAVEQLPEDMGTSELLLEGWSTESDQELAPLEDDASEGTLSFDQDPESYGQELWGTEDGN